MDAVRGVCAFILDNPIWFLIPLALLNLLSFSLYGIDKLRAKRGMWRIPEATLLWSAALFGALGAFLGMGDRAVGVARGTAGTGWACQ